MTTAPFRIGKSAAIPPSQLPAFADDDDDAEQAMQDLETARLKAAELKVGLILQDGRCRYVILTLTIRWL